MRKHNPRKWLHAILDLLPVLLIPVFMIYSHRHTVADGTPVATANTTIQYQYEYETNQVERWFDLQLDKVYYFESFAIGQDGSATYDELEFSIKLIKSSGVYCGSQVDSYSIDELYFDEGYSEPFYWSFYCYFNSGLIDTCLSSFSAGDGYLAVPFVFDGSDNYFSGIDLGSCYLIVTDGLSDFLDYCNLIDNPLDLPSSSDYLGNIVSATATTDVTIDYEDSTVTNVFMDNFANTVNTYFNFGNVFNLGGFWNWINVNMFGGTSSQFVYAIWNIIVYEFVMDLLFIFYAFFMFLIDFCECLLEKPFNKIR